MATVRIEKEATALYRAGYSEGLRFALQVVHDEPEPAIKSAKDIFGGIMIWFAALVRPVWVVRVSVRMAKFQIARKISAERAKS
jgi:hypothetical protein